MNIPTLTLVALALVAGLGVATLATPEAAASPPCNLDNDHALLYCAEDDAYCLLGGYGTPECTYK